MMEMVFSKPSEGVFTLIMATPNFWQYWIWLTCSSPDKSWLNSGKPLSLVKPGTSMNIYREFVWLKEQDDFSRKKRKRARAEISFIVSNL